MKKTEEEPCEHYRIRADINLDAICNNIKRLKANAGDDAKIMAIIKADGYGHGAVPIAKALHGIAYAYGVAIVDEGCQLREAGITEPILLLGYTEPERLDEVIDNELTQTIFDYETAKLLSDRALSKKRKAKIHIKLDTGMGRIGFRYSDESIETIAKIVQLEGLYAEGIFTHLARADEADKTEARNQYERFMTFLDSLKAKGISFDIVHAANSAATIDLPDMKLDMVRCGIATYGLYPSEEVDKIRIVLEPAMSITAHVSYVKKLEAGQGISYNATYVTNKDTIVATIPAGYADGIPRSLSSKGRVLIRGRSAPIIGRICMDQFMVDVTDIPGAARGDKVTLIGIDGDERITVEEAAGMAGSFNYEFVCGISKRVPRKYNFHLWNTND